MIEAFYDKINDYSAVTIRLASPETIRNWSSGEVKKPETINYRTFKPERDGLFCERIFGPEKDWECACEKYKGIKYKGITCDRCGVEVTTSRERKKRMGHITLATPCVHIWYFKAVPSKIGTLLQVKNMALERVIYYQDYIVTEILDPACGLKERQILNEREYRLFRERYPHAFEADMGGEVIYKLLAKLDLPHEVEEMKKQLKKTSSIMKIKEITKRLDIAEKFVESGNRPEWMVLTIFPVVPPGIRPLVLLENGTFATSDLNDLYRRVINRNNRLKKLMELNAPQIIIQNEKRMLQQAVDNLLDNTKARYPVLSPQGRPLKSLTGLIKGKQGRFRENLLGKRVDYSARSVIVVGPKLKLNECGLPKKIALELYQPFIIRELKERGVVDTIKSAKKLIEQKEDVVFDVLEKVIQERPVILNRAPTLHRLSIQAFDPVLVEGEAILLHPLVCTGFNADFDGDQIAVHLPLSTEAVLETKTLVMATQNCFSPKDGAVITEPKQDTILGLYYLTLGVKRSEKTRGYFSTVGEVLLAYEYGKVELHDPIEISMGKNRLVDTGEGPPALSPNGRCRTTVGRVIFNSVIPPQVPFYNLETPKKKVLQILRHVFKVVGHVALLRLLDDLKDLGFHYATVSGLSIAVSDLRVPGKKASIISETQVRVHQVEQNYQRGLITPNERYNQIIDYWIEAREKLGAVLVQTLKEDQREGKPYLNPLYLSMTSGARGSIDQAKQLAGMRGLMAKPSGKIIETPIYSNFREGLTVLEFFSSTHGARKGLADTALKTADAGYLTRKLVDVAQASIITLLDCGTLNGITKSVIYRGDKVEVSLSKSIYGRVARDTIVDLVSDEIIVRENELISEALASRIEGLGFQKVRVRSPLTCESPYGLCARCYGMDLATGKFVEPGVAVGVMAAQSIGEPGTQLTMRTFHIGGTAHRALETASYSAKQPGKVKLVNTKLAVNEKGETIVLNRNAELLLVDEKEREMEKYLLSPGAVLHVKENEGVRPQTLLTKWDPHYTPILAEVEGTIRFEDVIKDSTMKEEIEPKLKTVRKVIIEYKGNFHPQILIQNEEGNILGVYAIPERAYIEKDEGKRVKVGDILAKVPREVTGTQDITGGLPRVTELFEARRPKDAAIVSEIDGIVELGQKKKGKRTVSVKNAQTRVQRDYLIPHGKFIRVHTGDPVIAGTSLTEGAQVPHDILRIKGEEAVQDYLLQEVQNVYRAQGVSIDDKHIELIISQMLRRVRIHNAGDTSLLLNDIVDKFKFQAVNRRMQEREGKSAAAKPVLMGISKASLQSDSFIAAASFQETTKVLTNAAISGKRDELSGLKENVILGHVVPCGTNFGLYKRSQIQKQIPLDKLEKEVTALEAG